MIRLFFSFLISLNRIEHDLGSKIVIDMQFLSQDERQNQLLKGPPSRPISLRINGYSKIDCPSLVSFHFSSNRILATLSTTCYYLPSCPCYCFPAAPWPKVPTGRRTSKLWPIMKKPANASCIPRGDLTPKPRAHARNGVRSTRTSQE